MKHKKTREKITGIYSQNPNKDFGFIDISGEEKGYFVHETKKNGALHGDEVEGEIIEFRGKKEAIITRIIKRNENIFVGKIQKVKNFAFVVSQNPFLKNDIYISAKNLAHFKEIKDGTLVGVKITSWKDKNPEGKIIEILGSKNTQKLDILTKLLEGGARLKFPEYVLQEAKKLSQKDFSTRVDLREKLFYTIDGEDAKDLDDALYIEQIGDDFKLFISIADVAEYVEEGKELDKEAFKRGNSLYTPERVVPMLPEKLSNDLCSLLPGSEKLCMTLEVMLDKNGEIKNSKIYESILSSKYRLTYREVSQILDGNISLGENLHFGGILSQDLLENIQNLSNITSKISFKKQKSGVIDFDFPEVKISIDEEGNPTSIEKYIRYPSMKIIEQAMILANEIIGQKFQKIPFIYRIHPLPSEDDVEKLRNILGIFGFHLPYKNITPKIYSHLLSQIHHPNTPVSKQKILDKLILRSMSKAIYSPQNEGHFGLNLTYYSHFTAPIRRYSDIIAHRIIKKFLRGNLGEKEKNFYKSHLPNITNHISQKERQSEKLEYAIKDLLVCKYYQDKIGEKYIGNISGVIESGFFVELENGAEGFVSILQVSKILKIPKYSFESDLMRFTFFGGQKIFFQIGDELSVEIESVEIQKSRLNFDFLAKLIQ